MGQACCTAREDEKKSKNANNRNETMDFISGLVKETPRKGCTAITLGGFPDEINGEDRSWMNGRFDPRREEEYQLHKRETYWSKDGTVFVYMTAQKKWMVNRISAWERVKAGASSGFCSSEMNSEVLDPSYLEFTRIWDGEKWEPVDDAAVVELHPFEKADALAGENNVCDAGDATKLEEENVTNA